MDNLFSFNKMNYCKGDRPNVDCILCEVIEKSGKVVELEIYRNEYFIVCVNLYPYNPGHLLIAPLRHIEDIRDFNDKEIISHQKLLNKSMDYLENIYHPNGFNIGCNLGDTSGASISHYHTHIVPRFEKELGFVDIIGGAKIIVEDPIVTKEKLKKIFNN